MNIQDLTQYATFVVAVIAAVTGIWNLALQMRGKRDRLLVRLGTLSPSIEKETTLSVVSLSDHQIQLTDWGFVESNGAFTSIPLELDVGYIVSGEIMSRGSTILENFGRQFVAGYVRRDKPLGAYAISSAQHRPVIAFDKAMPPLRRIWIRLRLLFQPSYLGW